MATEQELGPSTPLPAPKPHVDVSGIGADDTVFSPGVDQLLPVCTHDLEYCQGPAASSLSYVPVGIVTPNHTISSLFRNISNTTGAAQQVW
jgi:hypothetical protein